MTPSSFLTQVESYRDPRALWPLAAVTSVIAHGVLLLGLRPLLIAAQAPAPSHEAIPIQLLEATPALPPTSVEAAPEPPLPPTAAPGPPAQPDPALPAAPPSAPAVQATPENLTSAPSLPAPVPPAPVQPAPVQPAPVPAVQPPPEDLVAPGAPPPNTAAPSLPTITSPPDLGQPAPAPTRPPNAATGGQLTPLGIQPAAYGRDFPDTPPQLLSHTSLSVQPWLSVCGWQNPAAMVSSGLNATVQLQLHVQPSGEISFARVARSSGNPAVDDLVSCVVQRQLRLQPAILAGEPFFTDAYLLETQVQF